MSGAAQLLCGYIAGLLSKDAADAEEGDFACMPRSVDAARTSIEAELTPSGGRYRITVEQLGDGA